MIDYHCHLLPGIDDGPATMEESVEMARALLQAGFTTVHCTPHLINGCYEADNAAVLAAVASLRAELARRGIGVELLPGREHYLDEFLPGYLDDPLPLGETRFLLVEIPGHAPVDFVKETCYRIKCRGYTPMIAHPERCALLAVPAGRPAGWFGVLGSMFKVGKSNLDPRTSNLEPSINPLLDYLRDLGCAFQGNLGSFAGLYGERVRRQAEHFRAAGLYSHYGSDLHSLQGMEKIEAVMSSVF